MERGYQEVSEAAGIAPASSGTSSLTRGRIHSLIRRATITPAPPSRDASMNYSIPAYHPPLLTV